MREITDQERERFARLREESLARQERRQASDRAWQLDNQRREADRIARLPQAREDAAFVLAWVQKLGEAGLLAGVHDVTLWAQGRESVAIDARGWVVCRSTSPYGGCVVPLRAGVERQPFVAPLVAKMRRAIEEGRIGKG